MLDLSHNIHFIVYLGVDYTILHEASFLQFLGSVGDSIEFFEHFVDHSESTFANG